MAFWNRVSPDLEPVSLSLGHWVIWVRDMGTGYMSTGCMDTGCGDTGYADICAACLMRPMQLYKYPRKNQ